LYNATRAGSGLPRELIYTPEQLSKVTVEQAVERVAKINEWRASQKVEANQTKARNPATETFKTYDQDNPKGLHWVELKTPKVEPKPLPPNVRVEGPNNVGDYYAYEVTPDGSKYTMGGGSSPEEAMAMANRNAVKAANADAKKQLQEALTYEGETMGHCVGGYCEPVFNNRQRIFSLRDKKGEPHVTIEMQPASSEKISDIKAGNTQTWEIHQVKGKGNGKPKDDYIPYVQDFIKDTGVRVKRDLQNTDLVELGDKNYVPTQDFKNNYLTFDEDANKWISIGEMAEKRFPNNPVKQNNFMQGSAGVLPYEMDAASHKGSGLKSLGDILSLGGTAVGLGAGSGWFTPADQMKTITSSLDMAKVNPSMLTNPTYNPLATKPFDPNWINGWMKTNNVLPPIR
jgi:hypothetical protein